MPRGALSAPCRLLAGFSFLIPVLGCCAWAGRAPLTCRGGPGEATQGCSRCGLVHRCSRPVRCCPASCEGSGVDASDGECGTCGAVARRPVLQAIAARCRCPLCRLSDLFSGSRDAAGPTPAPVRDSPFPRFHPVPKWPVFSPSSAGCDAPQGTSRPREIAPEPPPVPAPEPPPPPAPEVIPPKGKTTDGWRRPQRRLSQEAAGPSAWMFRPVSTPKTALRPVVPEVGAESPSGGP